MTGDIIDRIDVVIDGERLVGGFEGVWRAISAGHGAALAEALMPMLKEEADAATEQTGA